LGRCRSADEVYPKASILLLGLLKNGDSPAQIVDYCPLIIFITNQIGISLYMRRYLLHRRQTLHCPEPFLRLAHEVREWNNLQLGGYLVKKIAGFA